MRLKAGDIVFADTNILLTATDRSREHHHAAQSVFVRAIAAGIHVAFSGQILREYLVVATRRLEEKGLGLSAQDALQNVDEFLRHGELYEETEEVSVHLRDLVHRHSLTGKRIHDANVAATMLAHGLTHLLTQNPGDFKGIAGIQLLDLPALCSFLGTEG